MQLRGSARAFACGGWRLANHSPPLKSSTPFSEAGHATPTGQGAGWLRAGRARSPIPIASFRLGTFLLPIPLSRIPLAMCLSCATARLGILFLAFICFPI